MLLNAIIIVLRETLEAGVLISVLLSVARQQQLSRKAITQGLLLGVVGAVVYAWNLQSVSEWFDYAGQEVVNAGMQYAIYCGLLLVCLSIGRAPLLHQSTLQRLVALVVMLAVVREGAEIVLFYSSYWNQSDVLLRVLTSGFMGLMIGFSVGALCYYALINLPLLWAGRVQRVVLALMAAGMVAQGTQLLLQVDWLPGGAPLWDVSAWLPESSLLGELAYATLGYEAAPTPVEVSLYVAALLLVPIAYVVVQKWREGKACD